MKSRMTATPPVSENVEMKKKVIIVTFFYVARDSVLLLAYKYKYEK